ncbi:MAG: tyrosine/phenylalanine carboxypeptidase domain-containing protein, partial [Sphingomicrobium sp.]
LRSACAFIDDGEKTPPPHYRALGRSAYLAAALKADKKIAAMAGSFDFLLSISPINTTHACDEFLANKGKEPPNFHYRPLMVDPDLAKHNLYDIDLSQLEDPLLETLLSEKRREIDAQLTMLATRNTPAFRPASMVLYGAVNDSLLADAEAILADDGAKAQRGPKADCVEIAKHARKLICDYQAIDKRFAATVELREDVSGLMVSGGHLMVGRDSVMPAHRLPALLAHEVSVHLLTCFNGQSQGLGIFASGLAGYEGVQEGLGVFAEWACGGLTQTRLRLIGARVIAVHSMLQGAEFIDTYRLLHRNHGFSERGAFGITARVFRSGGLAKDSIYLKGFRTVLDLVAAKASLDPFWLGKIAPRHVDVIEELLQRGLVHAPIFTPLFLAEKGTKKRIARLREGGDLGSLLNH